MLRLAVVLLYTAGLARGEVAGLTLGDVDAEAGVVRVRESKFHKSRLVPLSMGAGGELRRYLRARELACEDVRPEAPLLCNRSWGWRRYTGTGLRDGIMGLFDDAGVRDRGGRRPRVHDLRHSFAVEALTRLYRRGDDVRSRLPHLALYLGHVSIVSTAHCLHFVPEVAALASERFADSCVPRDQASPAAPVEPVARSESTPPIGPILSSPVRSAFCRSRPRHRQVVTSMAGAPSTTD